MDDSSTERLASLRKELLEMQERTEKIKTLLKKEIKAQYKTNSNPSSKERQLIRQAKSDTSQSKILQLILGVSELKLPERTKYKYKGDYETFKLTATIVTTILTVMNLFVFSNKVIDTIQILTQMYIYSTLTIREHILINNGSNIKTWWLLHHYICIVITGMMLTCPESSFREIRNPILKFLFVLSCSQLVQFQYQMRRLYVFRALKKADPLEISSDVMSVSLLANLGVAVAILILFQFIQIYVAYYIYSLHIKYHWQCYQPLIGAILIGSMAIGNLVTILYTCYKKIEEKERRKHSTPRK
ncbi:hypothetical protein NEOKW01_0180 [Nematocida sp. AWRm80]|nr:hypothetical protein NEOKW01_0180 [Nematocida sp. AWRm80]